MVVDAGEVNIIMCAGMDSLIVDVVEMNVIMGASMHSLVSCFAVNNTLILQLWKYLYGCCDRGCARNMKMLWANRCVCVCVCVCVWVGGYFLGTKIECVGLRLALAGETCGLLISHQLLLRKQEVCFEGLVSISIHPGP